MDEPSKTLATEPSAGNTGKWIGRVMIAVLLGEGIWGLIVSLTNNLLLPFLSRTMGADAQSPLYLGKGEFNFPALFTAVLELCFAGFVAVGLYSWVQRRPRLVRSKPGKLSLIPEQPAPARPSATKAQVQGPVATTQAPPPSVAEAPGQFWSPPQPAATAQVAPPPSPPKPEPPKPVPAKPKAPKQIYYNIVGEPLDPED
jgi:cell division septation protein DedD